MEDITSIANLITGTGANAAMLALAVGGVIYLGRHIIKKAEADTAAHTEQMKNMALLTSSIDKMADKIEKNDSTMERVVNTLDRVVDKMGTP